MEGQIEKVLNRNGWGGLLNSPDDYRIQNAKVSDTIQQYRGDQIEFLKPKTKKRA